MSLIDFSVAFLTSAKLGNVTQDQLNFIESTNIDRLNIELKTDEQKLAFWLNLYNAFVVIELGQRDLFKGFFTKKFIRFKNLPLSLDDIEHGILRKGKYKWSLGYVKNFSPDEKYKVLMVNKLDARIHFALNCGANSCPPIICYSPQNVDRLLEQATANYLKESSVLSPCKGKIRVPRLFLWYFADFGGFKGIKKLYKRLSLIPFDVEPRISFLAYDWSINIDNFALEK